MKRRSFLQKFAALCGAVIVAPKALAKIKPPVLPVPVSVEVPFWLDEYDERNMIVLSGTPSYFNRTPKGEWDFVEVSYKDWAALKHEPGVSKFLPPAKP